MKRRHNKSESMVRPRSYSNWLFAAALVIVVLFVYQPAWQGGFIWDDRDLITANPLVNASDGLYRIWCTAEAIDYWPMTNTTFWIEWRLWGMNSVGYHLTNLTLHIIEALLIWAILRKLSIPGAFWAAMIFAVHPVNVETVAWIAQRKNLMAMLFFLLSILCYLEYLKRARLRLAAKRDGLPIDLRLAAKQDTALCTLPTVHCPLHTSSFISHPSSFLWYWLSLAAFALAMLGKGSVAILPLVLLGIVYWLRTVTRWDLLLTAPFFLIAAVLAAVNVWFQTHGMEETIRSSSFVERLLGAGGVVWFYLYKALLPINLSFIYPQWQINVGNPLWWLPLTACVAVTAVLWWYRESWGRPLLFAWGFFCVALLPVTGLTDVYFMKFSLVADHYQHIAIIGATTLATAGLSIWRQQAHREIRRAATVVAIAAVCAFTFLTWRQSRLYSDEITLYQDTLEKNPGCWLAHTNLGIALLKANRQSEAMEHFRQAFKIGNRYPEDHNNLGTTLAQTGLPQQAIEHYQQALALKPNFPEAHYNLSLSLVQIGRFQEAVEHYQQALRLKSNFPQAHNELGKALEHMNQPQQAIEHYRQALALKPDYTEVHYNLGNTLIETGRLQEAIDHYQQAIRLEPDYFEAYNYLGVALADMGRFQEAIEHFKQALRLKPDSISVNKNLSWAYASMNQSSEAVAAAEKALELARSQGKTVEAERIEDWLNSYRRR